MTTIEQLYEIIEELQLIDLGDAVSYLSKEKTRLLDKEDKGRKKSFQQFLKREENVDKAWQYAHKVHSHRHTRIDVLY